MRTALFLVFALLLAGCGSSPTTGTGAGAPAQATAPAVTTAAPATSETTIPTAGAPATSEPAAGTTPLAAGSVEAKAAEALVSQLQVGVDAIRLTAKEQVEWSDGSLGCPASGMMYTQAIVPGYRLTYTDGTNTYEVHTNESGEQAVLCENANPVELVSP